MIGVGGMGSGHLQRLLKFQEEGKLRVAAVCDADESRLAEAVKLAGAGSRTLSRLSLYLSAAGY